MSAAEKRETGRLGPLAAWTSPRRKRFWLILLVAGYTLFGFFLAPWLARPQLERLIGDVLQRPVSLGELRINPYVLSAEARGFRADEISGERLIGIDRLYVDLQLSSILSRALIFREVSIDGPYVALVRDESGTINIVEPFTAKGGSAQQDDPTDAREAGLPRVRVEQLTINAGIVDVEDRALDTDFETRLGPIDIAVVKFSTRPNESGDQRIVVVSEGGTRLEWTGSLQLSPLLSEGSVTVRGPYLPVVYRYFQDQLNFSIGTGQVDMAFDYRIALPPNNALNASIENLDGRLTGITASAAERDTVFLDLPEIRLRDGFARWPARQAGAASLELAGAAVELWRDVDGELIFSQLLAAGPVAAEEPPGELAETPPWQLSLDKLSAGGLRIGLTDDALTTPGRLEIAAIDLDVSGISNADGAEFPLALGIDFAGMGRIDVDGSVTALPELRVAVALTVANVALAMAQPWISDALLVRIADGRAAGRFDITVGPGDQLDVDGGVRVIDLDIRDSDQGERLVGWKELDVDRVRFAGPPIALEASQLVFKEPYARVVINEDGSTNFARLPRADAGEDEPTPAAAEASVPDITVGRIRVKDGAMNFVDLMLPLPFEAEVRELEGSVSTLATNSRAPTTIELEGKVDEYGFAQIQGSLLPADITAATDVRVLFRNVEFPDLSPYTIRFAGRRIDDGRLEVDLRYRITEGALNAQNRVVIDRIALGEKVAHPNAMDLPLGLAVALLQDSSGRINIDLPITGNLDDPEFSVGAVVLRAFATLITKAVTSPFRLLGGLIGVDSENFDRIEFEAGRSGLTPPEREKLEQLAAALALRPQLKLTVAGAIDPEVDALAIRAERVDARIEAMIDVPDARAEREMVAERRRAAIENLFREAFPDERLRDIRPRFVRPVDPATPDGETSFDELAYLTQLRERLLAVEQVTPTDLDSLAASRVDTIVRRLASAAEPVPAERVQRGATKQAATNERGLIPLKLALGR